MATFQIRYGVSTETGSSLKAGELYAATDLQTLQLSADGINSITLMSSASIVNSISGALEASIISLSSSISHDLSASLAGLSFDSSSLETSILNLSASIYTTDATQTTNIIIASASAWGAFQSASAYSSSGAIALSNVSSSLETSITTISTSVASRLGSIESLDTKYATTGSNTFTGNQIVSASVYVTGDLIVFGTSSIQNVTGSILDIGTNQIILNTATPAVRFAGISVIDSGSTGATGSLYWDSLNNGWVYQKASGSSYHGAALISGPRNSGSLGDEQTTNHNAILKGQGGDHLTSSVITEDGNTLWLPLNLSVSGSTGFAELSGSLANFSSSLSTYNTTNSASAWGAFESASSYSASFYTTINNTTQSVLINSQSAWGAFQSASLYSASIYTRDANQDLQIAVISASAWGAFQSASSYSASLETSISASNHRIDALALGAGAQVGNDNIFTGQNKFTQYITGSISGAVYGLGDTYLYSQSVASRLTKIETTYATTGSNTFNGSQNIAGDITASGNLFVSGTIYAHELHTIFESSSIIYSSGSNNFGNDVSNILTITGSLNQSGSTSFTELTGSLVAFSASLNTRFGDSVTNVNGLSSSIYQTDATQSNNIATISASAWGAFESASSYSASLTNTNIINSASAWGAFQSASSYSGSFYLTINSLSSSIATTDATQTTNITTAQNSANGAFASASAYSSSVSSSLNVFSSSVATTISNLSSSIATTNSNLSSSAYLTYAKLGTSNQFNGNQTITGSLTVTGDVTAYYSSDERLKDNIQLISNPIEKVQQLRGVEFDWNDRVQSKAGEHDYGVIAQDVLAIMPELVKQRYDGYYGVDYDKIIGLLIEVVKNQENRIKDLENKLGS